jgi:hypothetical protein
MSEVANTIRDQIGHKAMYMLGAKNLGTNGDDLSFRIRGSKAVNYIKVKLNGKDLYDMEFGKVWGHNYKVVATHNDVYADMMHDLIESETGLYTKLF